ncbi:hypothetical protein ACW9H6_01415 [Pseudomonas sp. SDO528_S397]
MATAEEIKSARQREALEVRRNRGKTGLMSFVHKAYPGPGGAMMSICTEAGDDKSALKLKAVDMALALLAAKGFTLPSIEFQFTDAEGVPCVAYMGNATGGSQYTIFMGPKTGVHNPLTLQNGVPGGLGKDGPRGLADQVYDGTQRWFGNPRMHNHAATVVIHEIGHVLHEISAGPLFWDLKLGRQDTATVSGVVSKGCDVSLYATNNALEFVAETFAGCLSGKTYSEQVMAFYRSVGGPFPPSGSFS